MNLQGKNVLITGINGFLGTCCARKLLEEGAHVIGIVMDYNKKSRPATLDKCSIINGDIRNKDLVQYTVSKYEADYILHLAAQPIVRICDADPYTAYMTNVVGTLNILEAVRTVKRRPSKVIVISSDKAYGPHAKLPYTEDSELVVADTYCTSKACEDMVARSYAKTYDLPIVVVRAGNLYGPGDLNTSRLIPRSIIRLLGGRAPVLYSTVAEFVREFIYIEDAFYAFRTLLEHGKSGEAYNIGSTGPLRIGNVIELIRDKIDPSVDIELIDRDFYEIKEQYLDSSKLKALGWSPMVDLDEGLDRAIAWYRHYISSGGTSCI